MSGTEEEQEVEGVSCERELEDDALAEAQAELENEFGADFEDLDHGQKGFAQRNNLPFYTDVEDTVKFLEQEIPYLPDQQGSQNPGITW
jgi:hypothetical protein